MLCWGNASGIGRVMLGQKMILRAMLDKKTGDSCRPLFKSVGVLSVVALYGLAIVVYVKTSSYSLERAVVDFFHMREND